MVGRTAGRLALTLLAMALVSTTLIAAEKPKKGGAAPALPDISAADYVFARKLPGYITAYMVLKNPKKLRPLWIAGRSEAGMLQFRPADMKTLGGVASDLDLSNLGGLVSIATGTGTFSVVLDTYAAARADEARFAGTAWLKMEQRPKIEIHVESLENWVLHNVENATQPQYKVDLKGKVVVAGKTMPLQQPVIITCYEVTKDSRAHMVLRTDLNFKGAELGLDGDDAGPVQARLTLAGYVNAQNVKDEVTKEAQNPDDVEEELDRRH